MEDKKLNFEDDIHKNEVIACRARQLLISLISANTI